MIEFVHTVKDPNGIHARPAGLLAKEAARFDSDITISKGEKCANVKGLFSLLTLTVKSGDLVKINVTGNDEEEAAKAIKEYLEKNI